MKKFVLSALTFIGLIAANSSSAQSFSFPHDTVRYAIQSYAGREEIHNDIKNESSAPIQITWKILSENLHSTWRPPFGFCDNVTCYTQTILGNPGSSQTTMAIDPGKTS